jgi:hypothetical protein
MAASERPLIAYCRLGADKLHLKVWNLDRNHQTRSGKDDKFREKDVTSRIQSLLSILNWYNSAIDLSDSDYMSYNHQIGS